MEEQLGLLGSLVVIAAFGAFWCALFRKAGYVTRQSVLLAIAMFVPIVNVGIAVYFALATWPIEDALNASRAQAGHDTKDDVNAALSRAGRLQRRGGKGMCARECGQGNCGWSPIRMDEEEGSFSSTYGFRLAREVCEDTFQTRRKMVVIMPAFCSEPAGGKHEQCSDRRRFLHRR